MVVSCALLTIRSVVYEKVTERVTMGDFMTWRRGNWVGFPAHDLGEHTVCVGSSGSGKIETLLRLAYGACKVYGRQVIFIDAKGDERQETAARFVAAMRAAGAQRIRMFPATYYDGWKGSAVDLFNRLISVIDYSESRYYSDVAADVLRLVLNAPTGVLRSIHRAFLHPHCSAF
jgi:hypothetical protein